MHAAVRSYGNEYQLLGKDRVRTAREACQPDYDCRSAVGRLRSSVLCKSKRPQTLQNAEQRVMDLRLILRTLREMTDIKSLTPTLVNSLIERIEVHNSDKSSGHSHVKVDIYFTAVGMIDIPTEKEILATMEEIRNNPQDFKFVA